MARCEMMYAMFNDNFIEASADMVGYEDFFDSFSETTVLDDRKLILHLWVIK